MFRLILLSVLTISWAVPIEDSPTCGYQGCPAYDPDVLNVHIVAHTHDDVGWLKTVDQYYYGSKNYIQNAGVQYILDSVIKELWADPKRRFIYVETAFFWKWWVRQSEEVQHIVHTLVKEGRLQFVGGAWSMNDEAAAHYHSTIDQFTWGLSKINETFGPCALPRVGWQIDPFGHSREFASLLASMGYDGLFLGRIDYQDKRHRQQTKSMEMVWRGDDDLGAASDIFTGVLHNTYSPPPGFCFDLLCSDEPIVDDPLSPMYNVDERVSEFVRYVRGEAGSYATNNVLVTMGGDFNYQDAVTWFTNLDLLIKHTNLKAAKDGLNIKLYYSTPNCYLKAVKEADPILPTKRDDFFPYASDPNAYWTGYFTSRPTTKYFERKTNNYLQMLKQIQTLTALPAHNIFVLNELKSAMGIMQHHDAITGTEKQHVSRDYERILTVASDDSAIIARQGLNKAMQAGDASETQLFDFDRCHLNESRCDISEQSKQFVVTVYNPASWTLKATPVRIPVTPGAYAVTAPNGEEIVSQIVEIPDSVKRINNGKSKATHEIVFEAYNVKAVGFKSFYIQKKPAVKAKIEKREAKIVNKAKDNKNNEANDLVFINAVNDYWKSVRDNRFVDVNNLKSDFDSIKLNTNVNKDKQIRTAKVKDEKVPEKPVELVKNDNNGDIRIENVDLDILKDDKNVNDDNNERFKELRDMISEKTDKVKNVRRVEKVMYPEMNKDELRMLADDPQTVERHNDDSFLENENIKIRINNTTGEVTGVILADGTEASLNLGLFYYPGCVGNNLIPQNRSSGAYIFRPNATSPTYIKVKPEPLVKGPVVQEARFTGDFVSLTVKVYANADYLELDWVVGPIPVEDGIGKEVVIKYGTNIVNNGEFYTDSNGRQMLKRKLNQRPQWNLTVTEPIAGNYYPVTNEIYIEDDNLRLAVYTDRSEGGSSLEEGTLEAMLHRRLLHDDAFGVGEALNEKIGNVGLTARGSHRVYLKQNDKSKTNEVNLDSEPIVLVSDAEAISLAEWLTLKNMVSFLKNDLPKGVRLLTVEPWMLGKSILVRLENVMTKSDEKNTLNVDLRNIFNIKLKSLKETTLSGNMWLGDKNNFTWKTKPAFVDDFSSNSDSNNGENVLRNDGDGFNVSLKPKEIRTFIVEM